MGIGFVVWVLSLMSGASNGIGLHLPVDFYEPDYIKLQKSNRKEQKKAPLPGLKEFNTYSYYNRHRRYCF